ncbi:hypothetical protein NBRC111894_2424 [Sporolactobacillus inulinus]|jgi:hypothetical protein|uniref:Uncharacterized protein n=1 Tax=Sporolactobacillus inulinus TaxID=2078 RepID=A0A4Y1ZD24_9BACL|nr:hypothetical protein NBRC111894_2424 [Sporolactobacillus inulinus]
MIYAMMKRSSQSERFRELMVGVNQCGRSGEWAFEHPG